MRRIDCDRVTSESLTSCQLFDLILLHDGSPKAICENVHNKKKTKRKKKSKKLN